MGLYAPEELGGQGLPLAEGIQVYEQLRLGDGAYAFQRAVSRLLEMQGDVYIGLGHLVSTEAEPVTEPVACAR